MILSNKIELKMKKAVCFLALAALWGGMLSVSLTSCGGDDDDNGGSVVIPNDEPGGAITKINPVKEELKPFIGNWNIKSNSYYSGTFPDYSIFFFQDNKCHVSYINVNRYSTIYSWEYDSQNKYLSIAGLSSAQWQITANDDVSWSGLALWDSGSNGYTAKKDTTMQAVFRYRLGMENAWTCDTIEAVYNSQKKVLNISKSYVLPDKGVGTQYGYYSFDTSILNPRDGYVTTDVYYDKEKDVLVFDKAYWSENHETGQMDRVWRRIYIQMVHPFSYEDIYLNIFTQSYNEKWKGKFLPKRNK